MDRNPWVFGFWISETDCCVIKKMLTIAEQTLKRKNLPILLFFEILNWEPQNCENIKIKFRILQKKIGGFEYEKKSFGSATLI
jgi:hypothetical protein